MGSRGSTVDFLFANCSFAGPKVLKHVARLGHFSGVALSETHLFEKRHMQRFNARFQQKGFVQSWVPSRVNPDGTGSSAGLVAAVKKSISFSFQPPPSSHKHVKFTGLDWVAFMVRFKGVNVLIFYAYFTSGPGVGGVNGTKFVQMLRVKRILGVPSLLVADFNMTPQEVIEGGWARLWNGQVLVPDVDFTCNSRGTKRVIDFGLGTLDLLGWVAITPYFDGP